MLTRACPAPRYVQGALCDDDAGVRAAAGGVFNVLFKSGGGSAMDSVIPALLGGLDSEAHSEQVTGTYDSAHKAGMVAVRPLLLVPAGQARGAWPAWALRPGSASRQRVLVQLAHASSGHNSATTLWAAPLAGPGGAACGAGRAAAAAERDGAAPHQAAGHVNEPARAGSAGRGRRWASCLAACPCLLHCLVLYASGCCASGLTRPSVPTVHDRRGGQPASGSTAASWNDPQAPGMPPRRTHAGAAIHSHLPALMPPLLTLASSHPDVSPAAAAAHQAVAAVALSVQVRPAFGSADAKPTSLCRCLEKVPGHPFSSVNGPSFSPSPAAASPAQPCGALRLSLLSR